MRSFLRTPLAILASVAAVLAPTSAERLLTSTSLNTCQDHSEFTAKLFNVVFTPDNSSASINIVATSSVNGHVIFDISAYAYGYNFINEILDPCKLNMAGLCPMVAGTINIPFNVVLDPSAVDQIPAIAYGIPDLDASVKIFVNLTSTGESVACVQADISNGKTVDLVGVQWATAVIAGLALFSSAIVSGLGHFNAASHLAANSLSLFGYFQSQAMLGLTAVPLPPIAQSWTQDFQWSMGIIYVPFMQNIFTWYQRATGGTPSTIFDSLTTQSVQIEKRGVVGRGMAVAASGLNLFKRGLAKAPRLTASLLRRGNIQTGSGSYVVYGIQRVAFRAHIESTNLFLTCLVFFCIFVFLVVMGVALFKGFCELGVRQKWMHHERFQEFRNGWLTVLKGILFRVALIGFPQMVIFCLWEFTQVDSIAEVILAVFFLVGLIVTLAWGASKVIRIARRSVAMHRNPAYILFSDPQALNKWGFLYVQFRASAYYFIVPLLIYILIKGMFVALAQKSGVAQAIGLIVIEAAALIGATVLRPWMDKPTNSFNIAIFAVNFVNAIFLLIYTNVFDAPDLVVGVVGVVLFVVNAAFALILLIMVIVSTAVTLFRKNPDARYQFMGDDRASFMKSQTQLNTTTELDALAATARGDKAGYKAALDMDEDNDSLTSSDMRRRGENVGLRSQSQASFQNGPLSPANPAMPLFTGQRPESPFRSNSPSPYNRSGSALGQNRAMDTASPAGGRSTNSPNPWQRGAGYN